MLTQCDSKYRKSASVNMECCVDTLWRYWLENISVNMAYLTLCVDIDVMMSVSISAQSTVTNVGVNSHVSTSISLEPKQWYINNSFFFWVVLFSECLVQTESFVLSWSSFCQFYIISYRLSTTWVLLECYLSATWVLLECYLGGTWVLRECYSSSQVVPK